MPLLPSGYIFKIIGGGGGAGNVTDVEILTYRPFKSKENGLKFYSLFR